MEIKFQCPDCGAVIDGTAASMRLRMEAEGINYSFIWDCGECDCGAIMLPVATKDNIDAIGIIASHCLKGRSSEERLLIAEQQVGSLFPWKKMNRLPPYVASSYWSCLLPDGRKLEYWPATDRYRCNIDQPRGVSRGQMGSGSGIAFIKTLREQLDK